MEIFLEKIRAFFKGLFSKKSNMLNQEAENFEELLQQRATDNVALPVERIINKFDEKKPSILIIDDSRYILSMVEEYLAICGVTEENFNILKFYGVYAPFVMKETLKELAELGLTKIEYAIIDIVLPGKFKEGNKVVKMDGIDVSIFINEQFKCNKFLFFSGNVLNIYIDFIQEKINKFQDYFKEDLKKYIVIKTKGDDYIINKFNKLLQDKISII